MEMQFLTPRRKAELERIVPIWKQYRELLATADVMPIGQEPDGRSHTGFCAVNGEDVFLILLKEVSDRDFYVYGLPVPICEPEILATNDRRATLLCEDNALQVSFTDARKYLFLKAKVKK